MINLNCLSINKSLILASALPSNSSSPSLPHRQSPRTSLSPPQEPSNPTFEPAAKVKSSASPLPKLQRPKELQKPNKRRQSSVLEIERAIGAGIFRDRDDDSDLEENMTLFDKLFLKYIGKTEGSVEKRLRETGEWISERSEKRIRSSTKPILLFVARWIFPMWICAFLVASGIIRLPFVIPWVDDLLL